MKKIKYLLLIIGIFFLTGCTNDTMDNIEVIVTNYPNEFIMKNIYGEHSKITSIYPDGVEIENYKINKKQKLEYSVKDLFVYNGLLKKERNLALDLLSINPDLKIIDTAYILKADNSPEELWLNPSSLLMMAENVRLSLNEYITSNYLKKEVDEAYDELKIKLSELDTEYRVAVDSTSNKAIIVADDTIKYLEKFGLTVICIDDNANQKTISDAEELIDNNSVNYIFLFKNQKINDTAQKLLNDYQSIQTIELHKLDNISDEERSEKKDYLAIMRENLELIKKELYQ